MATNKHAVKSPTQMVADIKPKRDPFYDAAGSIGEFCEHVAKGGHMAGFCEGRGLPYKTVSDWVYKNPDRAAMYARAREERADFLFDEIIAISDETEVEARYQNEDVKLVLDATAVARNRLRVDTRKWMLSKMLPKVYGDKVTQEHTGAGGGPITMAAVDLKNLSDAELANMQAMLSKVSGG